MTGSIRPREFSEVKARVRSKDFSNVVEVSRCDLHRVLVVQREAFADVASALSIPPDSMPPLTEAVFDLESLFDAGVRFFAAMSPEGDYVGVVRAALQGDDVEVGRLAVSPMWQRRGIATALMNVVEDSFPEARRFILFTGARATAALELYASLGYGEVSRERLPYVELVWLAKMAER